MIQYWKNKLLSTILALSAFAFAAVNGATELSQAQFTFLSSIRSPEELVLTRFPKAYSVPVKVSGNLADEMKKTLQELNLEEPEYLETYNRKNGFGLLLANDCYSAETRELLAGILNPVEMIDVVLRSVVRYRDREKLAQMLNETKARRKSEKKDGQTKWLVRLDPTGERFAYSYEDMGAYIQESWLTGMVITVDSITMLAEQLDLVKHTRFFSVENSQQPPAEPKRYRYIFKYSKFGEELVPVMMSLFIDDKPVLGVEAEYRLNENNVVFDTRRICHILPDGSKSCLAMKYGEYRINPELPVLKIQTGGDKRAEQVTQAAGLANKAAIALRAGKIEDSVRILRTLVQKYSGTPQAVEAKKLLDGLPDGF